MEKEFSQQSHGFFACSEGRFLLLYADWEHVFLKLYYTACLNCFFFLWLLLHRSCNTCLRLTDTPCLVVLCWQEAPSWLEITILSLCKPESSQRLWAFSCYVKCTKKQPSYSSKKQCLAVFGLHFRPKQLCAQWMRAEGGCPPLLGKKNNQTKVSSNEEKSHEKSQKVLFSTDVFTMSAKTAVE